MKSLQNKSLLPPKHIPIPEGISEHSVIDDSLLSQFLVSENIL